MLASEVRRYKNLWDRARLYFSRMYLPQLRESQPIPKSLDSLLKNLPWVTDFFFSNNQHNTEFDSEITKIINQEIFRGEDLSGNIDDDVENFI